MKQEIGFVIPSYNESLNIVSLITKIKDAFSQSIIVIVDDSSEKENKLLKTNISKSKFKNSKEILLISRFSKEGRGSAVLRGYEELLKNKNIKYFFELDADLSHNPQEAENLLREMKSEKVDVVIGSRYLDKSQITKWPMRRKVLSKIINKLINTWLGLKISDYTNGFRLYDRGAVEYLLSIQLREKGFIALSETIYRLRKKKFKIIEVPITFTDREQGKSSAGLLEYKNSIIGILRIRIFPVEYKKS